MAKQCVVILKRFILGLYKLAKKENDDLYGKDFKPRKETLYIIYVYVYI